jgi:hypothetical protein
MIRNSEISRQLVAILVFSENVTMLLPFGGRYPQDKVTRRQTSKKQRKDALSAHLLVSRSFGQRNLRMI